MTTSCFLYCAPSPKQDSSSVFSQEVPTAFPLIDAMKLGGSELPGQMRKIIYRTFDCLSFYNAPRQSYASSCRAQLQTDEACHAFF